MKRVLVGLREHGDGLDAELAAGEDDSQCHLAAVRDQDFLKHVGDARLKGSRYTPRLTGS